MAVRGILGVKAPELMAVSWEAGGIFSAKKISQPDAGLIITGNEIYYGRIEEKSAPLIRKKLKFFGCDLKETLFTPDDKDTIIQGIKQFLKKGSV